MEIISCILSIINCILYNLKNKSLYISLKDFPCQLMLFIRTKSLINWLKKAL